MWDGASVRPSFLDLYTAAGWIFVGRGRRGRAIWTWAWVLVKDNYCAEYILCYCPVFWYPRLPANDNANTTHAVHT